MLGSAKGWAASFLFHPKLRAQFQAFVQRTDTFSLGVCNGCQLMSLLGWIDANGSNHLTIKFCNFFFKNFPGPTSTETNQTPDIVLERNKSERFECRFSTVKIESSKSIMLRGMENSELGVWVAHGEGRFAFRSPKVIFFLLILT